MANVILRVKREDGSWAEIPALVGPEGPQGVSIDDIVLKSQEDGVSTYLILLSDGSEKTFQVTDGAIITDVSLINTNALIDTYRISISDGSYFDFKVTNGRGIKSIAKTSTDVLSDTYTISYNDNTSSTFKVTNGRSIIKIVKTQTDVLTDTYTISYNDNTTSTYTITNGRGIDYIEKDETIGISDRYTIHYNDGTTSYYHVVNGEAGPAGSIGNRVYLSGVVDKVNDETGYERVKELKTSKFDKSKFTVVGNPIISDDGVASGFSDSNYLDILSIDVTNKDFEIDLGKQLTPPSFIASSYMISGQHNRQDLFSIGIRNGKMFVGCNGIYFVEVFATVSSQTNTYYWIKGGVKNNLAYLMISTDGINYTTYTDTLTNPYTSLNLRVGYSGDNNPSLAYNGSINLSQFSITVDGKEVFSGNPTAIDTIKANNYTTVGSPTISSDGIGSAFTSSNYIKSPSLSLTPKKDIKVNGRYYYKSNSITNQNFATLNFSAYSIFGTIHTDGGTYLRLAFNPLNLGGGGRVYPTYSDTLIEIPLKDGDIMDYELIISTNTITCYMQLNEGVTYTASIALSGITDSAPTTLLNAIDTLEQDTWGGTIDLNTIHIYVDGNLVYQPCLKIPYTKAKTGSKIVDAAWKLRVEDCYNQYGAGNYYLFSSATEQFALPMPDIYGLIQTLEEKKVNRAGDTMTGNLSINCVGPQLKIYRQNLAGDTPETNQLGQLCYYGSDNIFTGAVENVNFTGSVTVDGATTKYPINSLQMVSRTYQDDTNFTQGYLAVATDSRGNIWTHAPHPANKLDNSNKLATTNWVRNHCCTTPATTTSTASLDAPCYVIENYVNGTSWYRLWTDFWCEQGNFYSSTSHNTFTLNFLRTYTQQPYILTSTFGANSTVQVQYRNTGFNHSTNSCQYYGWAPIWYYVAGY